MPLMSVSEAAERYGLSPQRIRQLIAEGRLRARKFGQTWAVEGDDVAKHLRTRRPGRPRSRG